MPLGLIAAAAVAGVGVQAYEASQATSVQNTQLGMQQALFGEQQGFEQQLAQLIANPSSVTSLPGYQFQFQQGSDSVAREMAASGFLGSGNEAAALTQYGQGYAQNFYLAQANLLAQLAGMGPSSAQGAGANAVGAQANTSQQMNNMLTQMGALAGMGYGQGWFGSSTNVAPGYAIANNTLSGFGTGFEAGSGGLITGP